MLYSNRQKQNKIQKTKSSFPFTLNLNNLCLRTNISTFHTQQARKQITIQNFQLNSKNKQSNHQLNSHFYKQQKKKMLEGIKLMKIQQLKQPKLFLQTKSLIKKNIQRINSTSRKKYLSSNSELILVKGQISLQKKILKDQNFTNKFKTINKDIQKIYTYSIGFGNNDAIVRKVMAVRKNWKEVHPKNCFCNLKWYQTNKFFFYSKKRASGNFQLLNHFEFNSQITYKNLLIKNLQLYTQTKNIELFSFTPITFLINFQDADCQYNIRQFLHFFLKHKNYSEKQQYLKSNQFLKKIQPFYNKTNSEIKKKLKQNSKPILKKIYGQKFIWILKPISLNQGKEQLQKIFIHQIKQNQNFQKDNENKTQRKKNIISLNSNISVSVKKKNKNKKEGSVNFNKTMKLAFVIQKYIQKPLLINKRKFDLRIFIMITQNYQVYFFEQGYLRTSSQSFTLKNLNNNFIHLTNNSVQKNSSCYGLYQQGNQISFDQFRKIIAEKKWNIDFDKVILQKIKEISFFVMISVKKKLDPHFRGNSFEIFGLDFLLDQDFGVWLIQVNSNPSLQMVSEITKLIIPRLLDDCFKLTIDIIFPTLRDNEIFFLPPYQDKQNLWSLLGKLKPNEIYKKKQ